MNPSQKLASRYLQKNAVKVGDLDYAINKWLGDNAVKLRDSLDSGSMKPKASLIKVFPGDGQGIRVEITWMPNNSVTVETLSVNIESQAQRHSVTARCNLFWEGPNDWAGSAISEKTFRWDQGALANDPVGFLSQELLKYIKTLDLPLD